MTWAAAKLDGDADGNGAGAAAAAPMRVVVRFRRGVDADAALARVLALPDAHLVVSAASLDGRPSAKRARKPRELRRIKGAVRGVLVELPAGLHRGATLAALKALDGVADAEEEGTVTVQAASAAAVGGAAEVPPGLLRVGLARYGLLGRLLVQPTVSRDTSVGVAVVDTGVDRSHPDLNVVGGVDFTPDNDYGLDGNGHGTHVRRERRGL